MKLSEQDVKNLQTVLSTCSYGGIDTIVIDDGYVRGINDARSCAIISNVNIPKISADGPGKMGLSRLSALKSRIELLGLTATVDLKMSSNGSEISQLEISAGRNKAQYRCTATALIKAPKVINDTPAYSVEIDKEQLQLILNGLRVYGAKTVCVVIGRDEQVSIEAKDTNNDVFSVTLENTAKKLSDDAEAVAHYFASDIFTALLKAVGNDVSIIIGAAGTMTVVVNGHTMTILPQITGEE